MRMMVKPIHVFFGLFLVLAVFCLSGILLVQSVYQQYQSRLTLDRILGESNDIPTPSLVMGEALNETLGAGEMDGLLSQLSESSSPGQMFSRVQPPQIQFKEEREAYIVTVPLQHPEDEKEVDVVVESHRIQVTGQSQIKSPDGQQVFGTSSFAKSIRVSDELLPEKISRTVENKMLVVTIPKKHPSDPETPSMPPNTARPQHPRSGATDIEQKLRPLPKDFI